MLLHAKIDSESSEAFWRRTPVNDDKFRHPKDAHESDDPCMRALLEQWHQYLHGDTAK